MSNDTKPTTCCPRCAEIHTTLGAEVCKTMSAVIDADRATAFPPALRDHLHASYLRAYRAWLMGEAV